MSRKPNYGFRYFNGHTVRVYLETTGLVGHSDHVVMDGRFPRGVFHTPAAAEAFCEDFSIDWVVTPSRLAGMCAICNKTNLAQVVSPASETQVFICRDCGYHTKKPDGRKNTAP